MALSGPEYDSKRAAATSGGTRRRLSVGIALLGDCELVVLDEPMAGVDAVVRRLITDALRHAKAGRTVVVSTHLMNEAQLMCETCPTVVCGLCVVQ